MLFLVRHGSATEAQTDRDRVLSPLGRSEVEALRGALEEKEVRVDRIFHSGLTRARETAEILASLGASPPVHHEGLQPSNAPGLFIAELEDLSGSIMIVSHMPFLPELSEELLENISPLPEFRTATAVCLEPIGESRGRGAWRLVWQSTGHEIQ